MVSQGLWQTLGKTPWDTLAARRVVIVAGKHWWPDVRQRLVLEDLAARSMPIIAAGRHSGVTIVSTYHPGAHIAGLTRDAFDAAIAARDRADRRGTVSDEDVNTYGVRSTSSRTAQFDPVEVVLRENPDGSQRRLVLKVSEVEDPPTPGATLRATFAYQHRRRADEDWAEDNFNLATLHAGQEVRMELHSAETLKVYNELGRLYAASAEGIRYRRWAVTVTDADAPVTVLPTDVAEQIRAMLDRDGAAVFEEMARTRPDLVTWSALVEEHRQRAADLAEFEERLDEDPPTWGERDWQAFFRRAPWIFGHGLDYAFLVNEQAEPDYGGQDLGGSGGERGDELMRTAGHFRFAVLVELKRPEAALIAGTNAYRNGAWRVGAELAGGVAQLQANCERIREAANQRDNVRWLDERDVTVADPQGILVIGHTRNLADDAQMITCVADVATHVSPMSRLMTLARPEGFEPPTY